MVVVVLKPVDILGQVKGDARGLAIATCPVDQDSAGWSAPEGVSSLAEHLRVKGDGALGPTATSCQGGGEVYVGAVNAAQARGLDAIKVLSERSVPEGTAAREWLVQVGTAELSSLPAVEAPPLSWSDDFVLEVNLEAWGRFKAARRMPTKHKPEDVLLANSS